MGKFARPETSGLAAQLAGLALLHQDDGRGSRGRGGCSTSATPTAPRNGTEDHHEPNRRHRRRFRVTRAGARSVQRAAQQPRERSRVGNAGRPRRPRRRHNRANLADSSAASSGAAASTRARTFDGGSVDSPPAGFSFGRTGGGPLGRWVVRSESGSSERRQHPRSTRHRRHGLPIPGGSDERARPS